MTTLSLFRRHPEPEVLDEVETFVEAFEVTTGTTIVRQGEPAGGFFVVLSGTFTVLLETAPIPLVLGTLGPGDCFGETGLLLTGTHTATVRAASDGEVVCLPESELQQIVADAVIAGVDLRTAASSFVRLLEWGAGTQV